MAALIEGAFQRKKNAMDNKQESPALSEAKKRYERALDELNKHALILNSHNIEPIITGWSGPMERGELRMQGNAGVRYQNLRPEQGVRTS